MADKKNMKQWRCGNGHILAFIRWNADDLPQLMVLRDALDMDVESPHEVDVLGPVDGRMPVRCSICGDVKLWEVSVESLLALFSTLSDKKVFEFSQRLLELSAKVLDVNDPTAVYPHPALAPIGLSATSPKSKTDLGEEGRV